MPTSARERRLDRDEIFAYWSSQAALHGTSHSASWSDRYAIELEIQAILARLPPRASVVDVGCANGYSTARYAAAGDVTVLGVDYVPEMIDAARDRSLSLPEDVQGRLSFAVGDAVALELSDGAYDVAVSTRMIINVPTREGQRRVLRELARIVRPGGTVLISDATLDGWTRLNGFRAEWGLPPIPMPPFNRYLDIAEVSEGLAELELIEVADFASSYYVVTRVLKPLLARFIDAGIDVAASESDLNRWASQLPAAGDYGTQKLFQFRKP